ncbi:MAG: ATP-binding protein [Planctomycetota bacterium]
MQSSIVTRLIVLLVLTVLISFAALGWVFFWSTSDTFVTQRNEELSFRSAGQIERSLATEFEQSFEAAGWPGVQQRLEELTSNEESYREFDIFVIDSRNRVVVSNQECLLSATIQHNGDAFHLSNPPDAKHGFEIIVDGGLVLTNKGGRAIAQLFALPREVEQQAGNEFAIEVWQSAAIWLVAILALAIGISTLILKSSLRPLNDLTQAAEILKSGQIPAAVDPQGVAEFRSLIAAFNSATQTMAHTDQIRRRMVSDIAHELRTPLTNMRSILEAAESGLIDGSNEAIHSLETETRLLERLVEDFQQLTLFDTGQLRMNFFPVPLQQAISSYLLPMCEKDQIELKLDISDDLLVVADADRLKQAFCNLTDNSIRYAERPLAITVSAQQVGDEVRIIFQDNGPGIETEDSPYIFDRLYRAEKSRNRAQGGSGLGLAITKALLEAMGGTIRLANDEPLSGACFELRLPLAELSLNPPD